MGEVLGGSEVFLPEGGNLSRLQRATLDLSLKWPQIWGLRTISGAICKEDTVEEGDKSKRIEMLPSPLS